MSYLMKASNKKLKKYLFFADQFLFSYITIHYTNRPTILNYNLLLYVLFAMSLFKHTINISEETLISCIFIWHTLP